MNQYTNFKNGIEKDLNEFTKENMFFAFSNDQLKEGLEKFKGKKIVDIGRGCFILKTELDNYRNMTSGWDKNLKEKMLEKDFAVDAFKYELGNHEFCITYDARDTLDALGYTYDEVKNNKHLESCLVEARKQYLEQVEW